MELISKLIDLLSNSEFVIWSIKYELIIEFQIWK